MAKIISIEDIQDGMVNVEPIVNRYGQTLMAQGVTLNSQHITILKTWNIRTIKVSGGEESENSELSDELRELILGKIRRRAPWTPRIPIEEDMFSMAITKSAKDFSRNREGADGLA